MGKVARKSFLQAGEGWKVGVDVTPGVLWAHEMGASWPGGKLKEDCKVITGTPILSHNCRAHCTQGWQGHLRRESRLNNAAGNGCHAWT